VKIYPLIKFFLVFIGNPLFAQHFRSKITMPNESLAAYSHSQKDVFSFVRNQAALAGMKESQVGIFSEQRFMLRSLSTHQLAVCMNFSALNVGVIVNHFGFDYFRESFFGLAMARRLSDKVDLGIQFNGFTEKTINSKASLMLNFEMGALFHLSPGLTAGIHCYNPANILISRNLPVAAHSSYTFGIGYDASEDFHVSFELNKMQHSAVNVHAGFQYFMKKIFFAKMGYMSNTQSTYFGAGVTFRKIRLGIHCSSHPQLGMSTGMSAMFKIKCNK
jgi:hypothetical protein